MITKLAYWKKLVHNSVQCCLHHHHHRPPVMASDKQAKIKKKGGKKKDHTKCSKEHSHKVCQPQERKAGPISTTSPI